MKLKLPNNVEQNPKNDDIILEINANIKEILKEILNMQSEIIGDKNERYVKEILGKADLIILECHTTEKFKINKNEKFARLVYEYQRLNLKYESYQLNKQINAINREYNDIRKSQDEIKSENNNLVYTILGFMASFSIVSAAVTAISDIKKTSGIILFMAFTTFILITTLIGLNNFYKNNNSRKNKLQDNYFLWKVMVIVIFLIVGARAIEYIKCNKDNIFESIGKGIGYTINNQNENINE